MTAHNSNLECMIVAAGTGQMRSRHPTGRQGVLTRETGRVSPLGRAGYSSKVRAQGWLVFSDI